MKNARTKLQETIVDITSDRKMKINVNVNSHLAENAREIVEKMMFVLFIEIIHFAMVEQFLDTFVTDI